MSSAAAAAPVADRMAATPPRRRLTRVASAEEAPPVTRAQTREREATNGSVEQTGSSTSSSAAAEAEECTPPPKKRRIEEIIKEGRVQTNAPTKYPTVGRENECRVLDEFLAKSLGRSKLEHWVEERSKGFIANAPSGCLYVSGGPGTGKTCSIRAGSRAWREQYSDTQILEVNCMELTQRSPTGLLQRLAQIARTRTGVPSSALPKGGPALLSAVAIELARLGPRVVIIADEVDQLLGKRTAASPTTGASLEALFAITRHPKAPAIALVCIANAVDLLERSGGTEASICDALLFQPYAVDQLRDIMKVRLDNAGEAGVAAVKALGKVAMEVRLRQVAKMSGDCRQVVCLCEQALFEAASAAEKLEEAKKTQAQEPETPPKVARPSRNMQNDPLAAVSTLPLEQQVLLCALAGAKGEAMRFPDVCVRYKELCRQLHQPTNLASKDQVSSALGALEQRGLLTLRAARRAGAGRRVGGGPARPGVGSDSVVELAVSCKAVRETVARSNPLLEPLASRP